jgi:hypothetical protein
MIQIFIIYLVKLCVDFAIIYRLDIAHKVRTKTYLECERHYNQCYIEKVQDGLPGTNFK